MCHEEIRTSTEYYILTHMYSTQHWILLPVVVQEHVHVHVHVDEPGT